MVLKTLLSTLDQNYLQAIENSYLTVLNSNSWFSPCLSPDAYSHGCYSPVHLQDLSRPTKKHKLRQRNNS